MKRLYSIVLLAFLLSSFHNNSNAQCIGDTISKYSGLFGTVDAMGVSQKGYVVTGHTNGISLYDGINWNTYSVSNFDELSGIDVDDNKSVWAVAADAGLIKWENGTVTRYDTSAGFHTMSPVKVKVSPDGKIYSGSFGNGFSIYDGSAFQKFSTDNGLVDDYIVNFDFDKDGNVYMASINAYLIIYDGTSFIDTRPPTDANEVFDVAIDQNGGAWLLCYGHTSGNFVYHFDGSTNWKRYDFPQQTFPRHIETSSNGDLWVTHEMGMAKFDGTDWKYYTDADGLYESNCKELGIDEFGNSWLQNIDGITRLEEYAEIKGTIVANASAVTNGYVKLFIETLGVKKFVQYDSVSISTSGEYSFVNVPTGKFLIYAFGDQASYTDFIGTYYSMSETWKDADAFKVSFCSKVYSGADIELIEKITTTSGKGYISGHVKSADGTRAGSEPIKDVDVTLRKVPGGVVKQTKTNDFGFFEFDALANGFYGIIIDLPGLDLDTIRTVEITDTDTTYEDQDYEVDSTGVHAGDFSSIDNNSIVSGSVVYPNPTNGFLNIHFTSSIEGPIQFELLNINGALIYQNRIYQKGSVTEQIDISNYPNGIYLLKLYSGKSMKIIKVLLK